MVVVERDGAALTVRLVTEQPDGRVAVDFDPGPWMMTPRIPRGRRLSTVRVLTACDGEPFVTVPAEGFGERLSQRGAL
jgi:hypothetical protein